MENTTYHYDAFISYRHCDLDKFVAENLHKQLEAYHMPADIMEKRKGMKNKIERVFRDKEELPLTSNLNDPIMNALQNSDWLIVICSPRLRESVWCKKEIDTFISLHGREKVLAVLIEGEPEESFPEALLFKTEVVTHADGSTEEIRIPVEPLAADVRGKNKKEILKNLKTELLRILAAMFHLNFDDLRQRHKEQEHKQKMRYMAYGVVLCLLVAIISVGVAVKLNQKNKIIQGLSDHSQMQNDIMKAEQAISLAEKSMHYLEEGDREAAIQTAIIANTQYEGLTMPYTPEAQYALAECLGVYDTGEIQKANYRIETMGIITHVDVAPDHKTLIIFDASGTVTLYDTKSKEVILELLEGEHFISADGGYVFLENGCIAYINKENKVTVYNIEKRIVQTEMTQYESVAMEIVTDEDGKYLGIKDVISSDYTIYSGETLELIGELPNWPSGAEQCYINGDGIVAYSYDSIDENNIIFLDCNTMQELSRLTLENIYVEDIAVDGNMAYVFAVRYESVSSLDRACIVYGIDITTGQIVWENVQDGNLGQMMVLPGCENKTELLVLTRYTARLVNMQTGETEFELPLVSLPVSAYRSRTENSFEIFLEDGTVFLLDSEMEFEVPYSRFFDFKTRSNLDYILIESGVAVLSPQNNYITIYKGEKAEGVEISSATAIEQPIYYTGEEAQELANQYGLENAHYVRNLFFGENKVLVFASYWNNDLVIYDTLNENVVATLEDCDSMYGFFGEDWEGNMYLQGSKGGYVITPDLKFKMHIPKMVGVDLEQNKVYLQGYNTLYEAPIYTSVELLQMAAPYMDKGDEESEADNGITEG